MIDYDLIDAVREMARLRVERLNTTPGQRARSKVIVVHGEFVRGMGLEVPDDFDFAHEQIFIETYFHNNNGKLIAIDHSISRCKITATSERQLMESKSEEPQFIRFGLGEFMSDTVLPPPSPTDIKEQIVNLPREKQKEVYRWMNSALGCRI